MYVRSVSTADLDVNRVIVNDEKQKIPAATNFMKKVVSGHVGS